MIQFSAWSLPSFVTFLVAIEVYIWMRGLPPTLRIRLIKSLVIIIAVWALTHLARISLVTLEAKLIPHALLLPLTIGFSACTFLLISTDAGYLRNRVREIIVVTIALCLIIAACIYLPSSQAILFDKLYVTTVGDLTRLNIHWSRTGTVLVALPYMLLVLTFLVLLQHMAREPGRRVELSMYMIILSITPVAHFYFRQMWLDGHTPVNMVPVVIGIFLLIVAVFTILFQDRFRRLTDLAVIERLPDCLIFADDSGEVVYVNNQAKDNGFETGKSLSDIFGPEYQHLIGRSIEDVQLKTLQPHKRWDVSGSNIIRSDGKTVISAFQLEDYTQYRSRLDELKAMESKLVKDTARLIHISSAKNNDLTDLKHSLAEPLQQIVGYTETLSAALGSKTEVARIAAELEIGMQYLSELHKNLADSELHKVHSKIIDTGSLLVECARDTNAFTPCEEIVVNLPETIILFPVDGWVLRQIVSAVLGECGRWAITSSKIIVEPLLEGSELIIYIFAITDGIPDETLENFYSGMLSQSTLTIDMHGQNLGGFQVAQQLVSSLEGELTVETLEDNSLIVNIVVPEGKPIATESIL